MKFKSRPYFEDYYPIYNSIESMRRLDNKIDENMEIWKFLKNGDGH